MYINDKNTIQGWYAHYTTGTQLDCSGPSTHYLIVQGLAHYMYSTYMYVYYWTVQGLAHYMICMLYTVNDSLSLLTKFANG